MKAWILGKKGYEITALNRRKAIREKCLNCSGWIPKEVSTCSFHDCPLYPFRMATGKQNAKARRRAIRNYCLWCMSGRPSGVKNCPSGYCPFYSYRLGRVDRCREIDSEAKLTHMEADFEPKGPEKEWFSMGR